MNNTQYLENIRMGLDTLQSHKTRSFLTTLGVIIGVLTVIVIASILTGMRRNIIDLVEAYGTENIYAFHLSTGIQMGPRDRQEWQRKPLTLDDVQALAQQTEAVEMVGYRGFSIFGRPLIRYRDEEFSRLQLEGVSPNIMTVANLSLSEGRPLTTTDDRQRNPVCLLGVNVADALFPGNTSPLGKQVLINGNRFSVIGILEKRKTTFFGESEEDNMVLIPYRTLRKIAPRADSLLVVVRAREGELATAYDETEAVLRRQRGLRFDQPNNFDLTTADRFIEQFDSITASAGLVAIAISGVGLLVGGIGVMNIMLVSVTERTREIGIRKAVGAKRQDIVFQFLFEAMTLSSVGGLLGIVLAVLISYLIVVLIPELPASIPAWAVVTGFSVSLAVGLVFGVWPAVKASRLDPIESLRYE